MAADTGAGTRVATNLWNSFLRHTLAGKCLFFFFRLSSFPDGRWTDSNVSLAAMFRLGRWVGEVRVVVVVGGKCGLLLIIMKLIRRNWSSFTAS